MGKLKLTDREDGFEVVIDEEDGKAPSPVRTIIILEGQDNNWHAFDRHHLLDGREPPTCLGYSASREVMLASAYDSVKHSYEDNSLLIDETSRGLKRLV